MKNNRTNSIMSRLSRSNSDRMVAIASDAAEVMQSPAPVVEGTYSNGVTAELVSSIVAADIKKIAEAFKVKASGNSVSFTSNGYQYTCSASIMGQTVTWSLVVKKGNTVIVEASMGNRRVYSAQDTQSTIDHYQAKRLFNVIENAYTAGLKAVDSDFLVSFNLFILELGKACGVSKNLY